MRAYELGRGTYVSTDAELDRFRPDATRTIEDTSGQLLWWRDARAFRGETRGMDRTQHARERPETVT